MHMWKRWIRIATQEERTDMISRTNKFIALDDIAAAITKAKEGIIKDENLYTVSIFKALGNIKVLEEDIQLEKGKVPVPGDHKI